MPMPLDELLGREDFKALPEDSKKRVLDHRLGQEKTFSSANPELQDKVRNRVYSQAGLRTTEEVQPQSGPTEVIGKTKEGRLIVRFPDGSIRSEYSATITDPRINTGLPTNIPTIFQGVPFTEKNAKDRIVKAQGTDPDTGRLLPSFSTINEAEIAASKRSKSFDNDIPQEYKIPDPTSQPSGFIENLREGLNLPQNQAPGESFEPQRDILDPVAGLISVGILDTISAPFAAADILARKAADTILSPEQMKSPTRGLTGEGVSIFEDVREAQGEQVPRLSTEEAVGFLGQEALGYAPLGKLTGVIKKAEKGLDLDPLTMQAERNRKKAFSLIEGPDQSFVMEERGLPPMSSSFKQNPETGEIFLIEPGQKIVRQKKGKGAGKFMSVSKLGPTDRFVKKSPMQAPVIVSDAPDAIAKSYDEMAQGMNKGEPQAIFDDPLQRVTGVGSEAYKGDIPIHPIRRAYIAAVDVMDRTPGLKPAANYFRQKIAQLEKDVTDDYNFMMDQFTKIFGKKTDWEIYKGYTNPLHTKSMKTLFNITDEEYDNLINHLYTHGEIPAINARVQRAADTIFAVQDPINQKAMQLGVKVRQHGGKDPKERTQSLRFLSHLPRKPIAVENVNKAFYNRAYEAAKRKYGKDLTKAEFNKMARGFSANPVDDGIKRYPGLSEARGFDALEAGGGNARTGLEAFGYEPDPLFTTTHWNLGSRRQLMDMEDTGIHEYLLSQVEQGSPAYKYLDLALTRFMGRDVELLDKQTTGFLSKMRAFQTGTLLQTAQINNLAQFAFITNKAGVVNTINAAMGKYGSLTGRQLETAKHSGGMFNMMMAELTNPQHGLGVYAQSLLRGTGFTASEKWLRSTAAIAGGVKAEQIGRKFLQAANKQNTKKYKHYSAMLEEIGLDPQKILVNKGLTEVDILTAAQRVVNETTGRKNLHGLPLWANNTAEGLKTLTQFKDYMFTNTAELSRRVHAAYRRGGTKEAAKILGAIGITGQIAGEMTRDTTTLLGKFENPFNLEERTPKHIQRAVKSFTGDNLTGSLVSRGIDNQIAGTFALGFLALEATIIGENYLSSLAGPTFGGLTEKALRTVNPLLTEENKTEAMQDVLIQLGDEASRRIAPQARAGYRALVQKEKLDEWQSMQGLEGMEGLKGM